MQANPAYNSLLQMGCDPILIEASIRNLRTEDLSALLDWISDHSDQSQKWAQWLKDNVLSQQVKSQQAQFGQSIQPLINKQLKGQLIAKGHSKNVSQKSLLLTGNTSVQSAQKWIEQHRYDPDFEEQLRLQGQAYQQSNLTPQQARAKLDELTKKARQVRKQRQQEEAKERQRNRIRFTKQMQQAKRIAEQQAIKRQAQLDKIQKQRDEQYKRRLVEDMRRERNAKFGIKQQEGVQTTTAVKKQAPKLSLIQQFQLQCQQVRVGNHAYPLVAKTLFQTAQIYVTNIIKNNGEQKFRKINKQNKAFQTRIVQAFGGQQLLSVIGYVQEDNFLVLKEYSMDNLKKISQILQRYSSYY